MQQKIKPLLSVMASAGVGSSQNRWYEIKANGTKSAACIKIFDDIGGWGITANQFAKELQDKAKGVNHIECHIHSLGGDVMEGLAMYNMLKNHPATVSVYIHGIAASMGSVIAMAANKIFIAENAWIMVHKPWGIQGGNADDMRQYADMLDQFESSLVNAYKAKTGLDESAIQDLLKSETWMMGQDAIDQGFADEITDAVDVSASINSNRYQDFLKMPEQAQSLLKPKASVPNTPAPQANAPQTPSAQTPAPQAAAPQTDPQAQFVAAETQRKESIKAVFKDFSDEASLMNECLLDMSVTADQATTKLLAKLGQNSAPAGGAIIHAGNGDFVSQSMINALAARTGIEKLEDPKNHYRGLELIEMARASLTEQGISTYGMDKMEMIGLAFTHTSSDFGNILQNVAKKAMLKGAQEAEETFQKWTNKGELGDFKATKRVGLESFPTLDEIPDGGEYKQATLKDTGEEIQLATYGKMFSITRHTIINDDLGAFTKIPSLMGRAALRTIGNLVYAILTDNPKMSDGKALFHADHKNLMDAAKLSVAALNAADTAMGLHQDSAGSALNIEPAYLIVPRALKGQANMYMTSQYDPDAQNSTTPNTVQGLCDVIADARLDHSVKKGDPLPWFMSAGSNFDTIEVAYLDGNEMPHLEQQNGWNIDGTQFKVRLDAGVKALSHRTLLKNPGA